MTLVDRIKLVSKNKGWNLQKVASEAGLGVNSIYLWDKQAPSIDRIQKVADVLNVSVDYLLGEPDKTKMPVDLDEVLSTLGPSVAFGGKELTDEQKLKFYEMAKLMLGD